MSLQYEDCIRQVGRVYHVLADEAKRAVNVQQLLVGRGQMYEGREDIAASVVDELRKLVGTPIRRRRVVIHRGSSASRASRRESGKSVISLRKSHDSEV